MNSSYRYKITNKSANYKRDNMATSLSICSDASYKYKNEPMSRYEKDVKEILIGSSDLKLTYTREATKDSQCVAPSISISR